MSGAPCALANAGIVVRGHEVARGDRAGDDDRRGDGRARSPAARRRSGSRARTRARRRHRAPFSLARSMRARVELQDAEELAAHDLARRRPVGRHPGHEVALSERGGLAVRDRLDLARELQVIAGPQVAHELELGVRGQGADVAGLVEGADRDCRSASRSARRRARRCPRSSGAASPRSGASPAAPRSRRSGWSRRAPRRDTPGCDRRARRPSAGSSAR